MTNDGDMRTDQLGPYRKPPGPAGGRLPGGTLAFLRGAWSIERRLVDHRSGVRGSLTGRAEFLATCDPAVLRYEERGELRFGGHAGSAGRTLLYRELPGGAADVCFADGRAFYVLDLRSGHWTERYGCGPDEYVVSYLVGGPARLQERWEVAGPRKAYRSLTTLRRLDVSSLA
jgi:hypothetical protein